MRSQGRSPLHCCGIISVVAVSLLGLCCPSSILLKSRDITLRHWVSGLSVEVEAGVRESTSWASGVRTTVGSKHGNLIAGVTIVPASLVVTDF